MTVRRIAGSGAAASGWPAGGRVIPSEIPSHSSRITADGLGGAIVAWVRSDRKIRALRFSLEGPVAVLLSLASVEATPERVVLRWQGEGAGSQAGSLAASVERRTVAGEWERLGRGVPEGADALVYEDRAVVPDTRYGYRLAYLEGGGERVTAETWVEVPGAYRHSLEGFRPNPAAGVPVVAFTLAGDAPATLEFHDIAGRQVLVREVGDLGAGRHELRMQGSGALSAGIYLVRLRAAGEVRHARGVVVR